MNFSEKLKLLREKHNMKQSELAHRSGVTPNKIQRYEQSSQKPKGDDTLALARALAVTADYLLDDTLPFPPPEEHLSEKVVIISKLEGLIGALMSKKGEQAMPAERPDILHLPVYKLGAGFDVAFDAADQPAGEQSREMYFCRLGAGKFFAAELHGSAMRGHADTGFSLGEILVFKIVAPDEIASGDYVYVRTAEFGLFRQVFLHGESFRLRALNPADPEVVVDKHDVQHVCHLVQRVKEY